MIISPMSEHSMSDSEVTVSDDDTYRNCLDFYTCQWCLFKMSNCFTGYLHSLLLCVNISVLSKYAVVVHL